MHQPKIFTITDTDSEYQVAYYFLGAFVSAFGIIVGMLYFAQFREDPLGTLFSLLKSFSQALLTNFIHMAEYLAGAAKNSLASTVSSGAGAGASAGGGTAGAAMDAATITAGSAAASAAKEAAKGGIAAAAAAGMKSAVNSLTGGGTESARVEEAKPKPEAVKKKKDSSSSSSSSSSSEL